MAEKLSYYVAIDINYECDSGDGGHLHFFDAPSKDNQNEDVFTHYCDNPKDATIYTLKQKYPRQEWQAVNIDSIKV